MTYEKAAAILRGLGLSDLVDSGQQWYNAPELADHLAQAGLPVDRSTVLRWLKDDPRAMEFAGLGWRIKHDDAVLLLAAKVRRGGATQDTGS